MFIAYRFARFSAQARQIPKVRFGQEIQFGINRLRFFRREFLFAVYDRFSFGVIFQRFLRHERVGFMRAAIIYATLPRIYSVLCGNRFPGASRLALAALIAKLAFKRLVAFQGHIRDDKYPTHERAVLGRDHLAVQTHATKTANDRRLVIIDNDVGNRFSLRNGGSELQLVNTRYFGVGAFIPLYLKAGYVSLQASVVACVLDHCAHFQEENFRKGLVRVFHRKVGIVKILSLFFHRHIQPFGNGNPKPDYTGRIRQNRQGIVLRVVADKIFDIADTANARAKLFGFFFDHCSRYHCFNSFLSLYFPCFLYSYRCFPRR